MPRDFKKLEWAPTAQLWKASIPIANIFWTKNCIHPTHTVFYSLIAFTYLRVMYVMLKQGIKLQTAGTESLTSYCKHFWSIGIPCITYSDQLIFFTGSSATSECHSHQVNLLSNCNALQPKHVAYQITCIIGLPPCSGNADCKQHWSTPDQRFCLLLYSGSEQFLTICQGRYKYKQMFWVHLYLIKNMQMQVVKYVMQAVGEAPPFWYP